MQAGPAAHRTELARRTLTARQTARNAATGRNTPWFRRAVSVGLAVAGVLTAADGAQAAWTTSASGAGSARAGALAVPGGLHSSWICRNHAADLTVSWSAVTGADGYLVQWAGSSAFSSPNQLRVTSVTGTFLAIGGVAGTTRVVYIRAGALRQANWAGDFTTPNAVTLGPC